MTYVYILCMQEPDEARYYQDGEQEGEGEGEVIKGVRTNLIVSQGGKDQGYMNTKIS
jgi:hypothetical protein